MNEINYYEITALAYLLKDSLEDISYLLRIPQRKPFGTMEGNVKKALKVILDDFLL